jgi:hypothetical protein
MRAARNSDSGMLTEHDACCGPTANQAEEAAARKLAAALICGHLLFSFG